MPRKGNMNLRIRTITEFEYIQSLPPSVLANYLRTKLAHNQGCPPCTLAQVFTMCQDSGSCDDCWWTWLNMEHVDKQAASIVGEKRARCWDCRWGARGQNRHPYVACMNKKLYGVIMDADDYCSFYCDRPDGGPKRPDIDLALSLGELQEKNKEEVGEEIRRRYELKQLKREMDRRKREKEEAEGGDHEKTCEHKEDSGAAPDPGEGSDRAGDS